jgi:hypothetical protein
MSEKKHSTSSATSNVSRKTTTEQLKKYLDKAPKPGTSKKQYARDVDYELALTENFSDTEFINYLKMFGCDIADITPFSLVPNQMVDAEYLRQLMPNTPKKKKLNILDDLEDRCINFCRAKAESGNFSCEWVIPYLLPEWGPFAAKEFTVPLFHRIKAHKGLKVYAKKYNIVSDMLVISWYEETPPIVEKKVEMDDSNKEL